MTRFAMALVGTLAAATCCVADEWRVLLAEPPALSSRLPGGASPADGRFSLAANERIAFHIVSDDVLMIVVGPAELERADDGTVVRVHRGSIATASTTPGSLVSFKVAIAGAGGDLLVAPVPSGTLYVNVTPESPRFGASADEAVVAEVPDAEEFVSGRLYRWNGTTWQPIDEPLSSLKAPRLDFVEVNAHLGVDAARDAQIDVQQRLVLNLLDVDITAQAVVVRNNVVVPTELRVVTIGSTNTFVTPTGSNQQQSGLTPGQQGGFATLTFPGIGSPASLSIGAADRVEALRRLAEGRAFATGGQGLGTGGLLRLGIIPTAPSPGILIGGVRP
jgi:hypothetical protein